MRLKTGKTIGGGLSTCNAEKLQFIKRLIEEGALRPVIDSIHPLADVALVHRHVAEGHKRGSVVIDL